MKKQISSVTFLIVLSILFAVVFSGCGMAGPEMKISIEGKEFGLDCKVSEILDAGFELADIDHASHIVKDLPELDARTLVQDAFYIYKDGEASHVAVYVYNKAVNSSKFEECNVYCFKYDCGEYAGNADDDNCLKVLINGIDMRFTDRETVIAALEAQGFKFKDADKTDFFKTGDAYSKSLIGANKTSQGFLTVFNDYNYESGERSVNGCEIKLDVKYDTSGK